MIWFLEYLWLWWKLGLNQILNQKQWQMLKPINGIV